MNRKEIVEDFFKRGKLLTPKALELIEKGAILKDYDDLILDEKNFRYDDIRIIKNIKEKMEKATVEDQLKFFLLKYEKMRKIIMERIKKNFVSLNKLSSYRDEVFIIGMVKDLRVNEKKILELEDPTATVSIIFDEIDRDLHLDDVVAVQAVSAGKMLFGKTILYPDVPLRKPVKGFGRACFISDLHLDEYPEKYFIKFLTWFEEQDTKYLFVAGDVGDFEIFLKNYEEICPEKHIFLIPGNVDVEEDYPYLPKNIEKKNIFSLSNPSMVYLNGLKILLVHAFDISMLRKRYLGKSNVLAEPLCLEEIPDIVHHGHSHKPFVSNYKSITLVNSGSFLTKFLPVVLDFSTREWKQVNVF